MTKGSEGRFLLLYGSQTGQAKAIAEEIFEAAPSHGLDPEIHCLSMTEKKFCIEKEKCTVIVVSTTGDGEPPDTATKFWRRIRKRTLASDHLANLHFTVLGLGDSNYTNFCRNGKNFDERLEELGAHRFYPSGFADDATGLEIVAEPWLEGLYPALRRHLGLDDIIDPNLESASVRTSENGASNNSENATSGKDTSNSQCLGAVATRSSAGNVTTVDSKTTSFYQSTIPTTSHQNKANKSEDERTSKKESAITPPVAATCTSCNAEKASIYGEESDSTSDTKISNENQTPTAQPQSSPPTMFGPSKHQNLTQPRITNDEGTSIETRDESDCLGYGGVSDKAPSLRKSVPPLSESSLTLPVMPPPYLEVEFIPDQIVRTEDLLLQGGAPMPSAAGPITMATLVSATRLTRDDAVKTALDVELDISGSEIHYEPGDSFSIVCPNDARQVNELIQRLNIENQADLPLSIKLLAGTNKRRAAVPEYIPQPVCTLRWALMTCCDICSPPKKAFLRVLVDHTSNESEKRRLQELCSKQGASDYGAFIRDSHLSLLDVLTAFPSCSPPLCRLFEHLPRLQPRPYSVSSSPLADPQKLHFVFNIVVFPKGQGRREQREGVCTGWLSHMTKTEQTPLVGQMSELSIQPSAPKIPIYERTSKHFRLPTKPASPIIMIGPGTGVAPFVGFLQHRENLQKSGVCLGPAWLFFGCRHKDRDYLYRDVLEHHLATGVLSKLCLSFSRDLSPDFSEDGPTGPMNAAPSAPRYVQDNMRRHSAELCHWILEDKAVIYVCGDAKNMAKNVSETLREIIMKETGRGAYEAACLLATLREEKRYLEDVWT